MVLLDGDARTRTRTPATVRVHFGIVRPFIECWAATRGHLREITSGDVDTVLEPMRGHRRYLDKHQPRGISLERIRRDRILHEALATGADPLHLSLVFNIDHTNAMAYANAARDLLRSPAE